MPLKDKITDQKDFLLYCEVLGLLHDIGKLSDAFYEHRLNWRTIPGGLNNDPHDHHFFDPSKAYNRGDNNLIDDFLPLKDCFTKAPSLSSPPYSLVSIETAVHEHTSKTPPPLVALLKAADGVDAAIDRNNPLIEPGQTRVGGHIFDTDLFGMESDGTRVGLTIFKGKRKLLYGKLNKLLPYYFNGYSFDDRAAVLEAIRKEMDDKAFADTTRPNNDTSLWEHSYAVASLFKVILVNNLMHEKKIESFGDVEFAILGIGWDGLLYLASGHKIRDVVGRKRVIEAFKADIKKLVEYDYLLGNAVYEDDNGIYFIVARADDGFSFDTEGVAASEYGRLLMELRDKVFEKAAATTHCDIYPHFHIIPRTRFMTRITDCIGAVGKKASMPVGGHKGWGNKLSGYWSNGQSADACRLCGKRPVHGSLEVCKECNEIRINGAQKKADGPNETVFISEIVKNSARSRKAALIVARLDISQWLSGKMIRSLFVKQANLFEKELNGLGNTTDLKADEGTIQLWLKDNEKMPQNLPYDYSRIRSEIDLCLTYDSRDSNEQTYADNIHFLYNRRFSLQWETAKDRWDGLLASAKEEHGASSGLSDRGALLANILCAKTPTPSSVLDAWRSTEDFLDGVAHELRESFETQGRISCMLPRPENVQVEHFQAYEAMIKGRQVEVVWFDQNKAWIICKDDLEKVQSEWSGARPELEGKPFGRTGRIVCGPIAGLKADHQYLPLRTITATPEMLMAIVPADSALDITRDIQKQYDDKFGKVIGRLPLSIGHIFFAKKTPMFVVLDSARRMIRRFKAMNDQRPDTFTVVSRVDKGSAELQPRSSRVRGLKWNLPFKLGDGNEDWHHPYLVVENGKDICKRKTFFKTVAGDVVHFSELQAGDTVAAYPNRYDYAFLDSTARRFDIGGPKRPYLLDELDQGFRRLWDIFVSTPGMTDTKLRAVHSLLLSKFTEWRVGGEPEGRAAYSRLVEAVMAREFGGLNGADSEFMAEAFSSGLFYDFIELYFRILKKRLSD